MLQTFKLLIIFKCTNKLISNSVLSSDTVLIWQNHYHHIDECENLSLYHIHLSKSI